MSQSTKLVEFEGALTFGTIEMLLTRLRTSPEFREIQKPARKRLYSIFVESIDNIYKYSTRLKPEDTGNRHHPRIEVIKENGSYRVRTGNLVKNEQIGELQFKIERVNQLDLEALKSLYEEVINQETDESDTGAGLGLITMAMRTDRAIGYRFFPVSDTCSFFEIEITVKT